MHIEHLEARQFRNLEALSLELPPGFVVIEGPNAQGKTNTLEALYVCATGKSFRSAPPRELVRHDEEAAKLSAVFSRQGVRHQIEVGLTTRRSIRVDGRALRKTSQLLDLVNVVAFFPDDLRIVKGSPDDRRRFLDRAVANYRAELLDATTAYDKALRSRNRILRDHEKPPYDVLEVYDAQLCRHGEVIHRCRGEVLEELGPLAEAIFSDLMGESMSLELALDGGLPGRAAEDFATRFAEVLQESYRKDVARGSTSFGPHRGDLLLSINGRDARSFGSQGQQRASVLALKLAEVQTLGERLDSPPILLLDDVSSELDAQRTAKLFAAIASLETQVWVSTTGAAPLPIPGGALRLSVRAGTVTAKTPSG